MFGRPKPPKPPHRGRYVTEQRLHEVLAEQQRQMEQIVHQLEKEIRQVATQAEIDALVQQLKDDEVGLAAVQSGIADVDTRLTSAQTTLQAEIDALAANNPTLDLSALQAVPGEIAAATSGLSSAVNALATHVDVVGSITPSPPPVSF